MSDTERVRAWRQRLKDGGLVPMTIWVQPETKARYQDLAARQHRSGSELVQLALDAYRLDPAAVAASATDTEQLRAVIRDELDQTTAIITATVTAMVTETITAMLPALVQEAIPHGVSASVAATATATETETTPPHRSRQRAPSTPADDPAAAAARVVLGQRKLTPRQAAALRAKRAAGAPIKTLMQDYGLSKASVFRYLKTPPAS
jgi:hypothetical protein